MGTQSLRRNTRTAKRSVALPAAATLETGNFEDEDENEDEDERLTTGLNHIRRSRFA
jgi:hypothetical protein